MNPDQPPFDLVGAEVALHRAGRVARRRAAEMPRVRLLRRWDAVLDVVVRVRLAARDTLAAWRAGRAVPARDAELVGAEVALHRAGRVARRKLAAMPRRRAEARLDAELDEQVRARVLARLGIDPGAAVESDARG